jgi:hypothetical protein
LLETYEKTCCLYPSEHVECCSLLDFGFCSDSNARDDRESSFPKGEQEAAEGHEEVCEGATEGRAQNAKGATKKHEISVAAILIKLLPTAPKSKAKK